VGQRELGRRAARPAGYRDQRASLGVHRHARNDATARPGQGPRPRAGLHGDRRGRLVGHDRRRDAGQALPGRLRRRAGRAAGGRAPGDGDHVRRPQVRAEPHGIPRRSRGFHPAVRRRRGRRRRADHRVDLAVAARADRGHAAAARAGVGTEPLSGLPGASRRAQRRRDLPPDRRLPRSGGAHGASRLSGTASTFPPLRPISPPVRPLAKNSLFLCIACYAGLCHDLGRGRSARF